MRLSQGSDTRVIAQKNPPGFWVKNPAENLHQTSIQFQFVVPVITKDSFMFAASNNQ